MAHPHGDLLCLIISKELLFQGTCRRSTLV